MMDADLKTLYGLVLECGWKPTGVTIHSGMMYVDLEPPHDGAPTFPWMPRRSIFGACFVKIPINSCKEE